MFLSIQILRKIGVLILPGIIKKIEGFITTNQRFILIKAELIIIRELIIKTNGEIIVINRRIIKTTR